MNEGLLALNGIQTTFKVQSINKLFYDKNGSANQSTDSADSAVTLLLNKWKFLL